MIKILFICHGNVCRSAAAKYVMRHLVDDAGLSDQFTIDSAATSREEIGNPVYPPMRTCLLHHGISCDGHHARQMTRDDYDAFDYIIGMDKENLYFMNRLYGHVKKGDDRTAFWMRSYEDVVASDPDGKLFLLMDFTDQKGKEVADPWYTRDFEATYRDVLNGCTALLKTLSSSSAPSSESAS